MTNGPKSSLHTHVKRAHDYFFPHERNDYRPHFFSPWSIGVIAIGLIFVHLLYFADTKLVFKKTDFLASVLPGVLTELANHDRADNSIAPVAYDSGLAEAAQLAVNDMAAKGYFAHNSPDGKTPWYWLRQAGYQYTYAGQNLAVNFTDSKEVEQAWLNSPTHRANIMKSEYTRVGIAVANGTYNGKDATFVVQYFATPPGSGSAAAAAPVKVAVSTPRTPQTQPVSPRTVPSVAGAHTIATESPSTQTLTDTATTGTNVLGVSYPPESAPVSITVAPARDPGLLARVAASPHHALLALLTVLMSTTIVLLAIAIGTHLRRQYVEVIGGGFVLLAIVAGLILVSTLTYQRVEIPAGGNSAVETSQPA